MADGIICRVYRKIENFEKKSKFVRRFNLQGLDSRKVSKLLNINLPPSQNYFEH